MDDRLLCSLFQLLLRYRFLGVRKNIVEFEAGFAVGRFCGLILSASRFALLSELRPQLLACGTHPLLVLGDEWAGRLADIHPDANGTEKAQHIAANNTPEKAVFLLLAASEEFGWVL